MTIDTEPNQTKHLKKAATGGIKGLISSIPFIGSTITGAWDGYWASRAQDTIDQLSQAIIRIGEEKIDKEFISTEEFLDLFQKSLHSIMHSRSKKKAKFIIGLLTETLRKDRTTDFSIALKETFLFLLDQLTDEEMGFLYSFSQGEYLKKSKDEIYKIGDRCKGIALDGLIAKGILREDNTWEKKIVESMLGQEFICYIKLLANDRICLDAL